MPWNSDSGLVLGVEVEVGCGNVGLAVGYDEENDSNMNRIAGKGHQSQDKMGIGGSE